MNKLILVLTAASCIFFMSPLCADECMDGDCDNGIGTGFTEDNKVYEGEWKDGVPHGQGTLYVSKGKAIEGLWEKGVLVKEESNKKESEEKEK